MVDYESAIERPFQDIKKLLIGSLLGVIPVVNLIASGYIIENARNALNKNKNLPEWDNWSDLFISGLAVAIISILYSVPSILLFTIGFGSILIRVLASQEITASILLTAIAGSALTILAGLLLLLVAMYVIPIAILNYIHNNNFSSAFHLGKIFRVAFTCKYLAAWLIMLIYSTVVFGLSITIPIIGLGLGSFIVGITSLTIFTEIYSQKNR